MCITSCSLIKNSRWRSHMYRKKWQSAKCMCSVACSQYHCHYHYTFTDGDSRRAENEPWDAACANSCKECRHIRTEQNPGKEMSQKLVQSTGRGKAKQRSLHRQCRRPFQAPLIDGWGCRKHCTVWRLSTHKRARAAQSPSAKPVEDQVGAVCALGKSRIEYKSTACV